MTATREPTLAEIAMRMFGRTVWNLTQAEWDRLVGAVEWYEVACMCGWTDGIRATPGHAKAAQDTHDGAGAVDDGEQDVGFDLDGFSGRACGAVLEQIGPEAFDPGVVADFWMLGVDVSPEGQPA